MTISVVTASCDYKTDIPDYAHPEILDASAEVGDTDIILTSNVSDRAGIKECGFYFGEDKDNMTMYLSELSSDDAFSLTLRNVPRGKHTISDRSYPAARTQECQEHRLSISPIRPLS